MGLGSVLGSVARFQEDRHTCHLLYVRGHSKETTLGLFCGMVKGQAFIVNKREEIYPEVSGRVQSREKSRLNIASRLAKARAGRAGEWERIVETVRCSIVSYCIFLNKARLDPGDSRAESSETMVMGTTRTPTLLPQC